MLNKYCVFKKISPADPIMDWGLFAFYCGGVYKWNRLEKYWGALERERALTALNQHLANLQQESRTCNPTCIEGQIPDKWEKIMIQTCEKKNEDWINRSECISFPAIDVCMFIFSYNAYSCIIYQYIYLYIILKDVICFGMFLSFTHKDNVIYSAQVHLRTAFLSFAISIMFKLN